MLKTLVVLAAGAVLAQSAREGPIPLYQGIPGGGPVDGVVEPSKVHVPADYPAVASQGQQLRYVRDSGVCENSTGSASGYIDVAQDQSMFFWFFEARHDKDDADLVLWLNGGPGSSSMIGLFQEIGPCRVSNDSSKLLHNPYAWNNRSNVLYIDQPIGAGYSHGTAEVTGALEAAKVVWKALQLFLKEFKSMQGRDFHIWTESYGGHYGPVFADYFLDQSALTSSTGDIALPLKSLGVGNGLTAPLQQYTQLMRFAKSNPYHPLVGDSAIGQAYARFYEVGGCREQIAACESTLDRTTCSRAQSYCNRVILAPLIGAYDYYDVRAKDPDPYPPDLKRILTDRSFIKSIGAEKTWEAANTAVYYNFLASGDWMLDSRPQLERVIRDGVRTLIFCGDADYILNYFGVEAMVDSLRVPDITEVYASQQFEEFKVRGVTTGYFKNAMPLSYLRLLNAGEQVPAYGDWPLKSGEAALIFFEQVIRGEPISSPKEATSRPLVIQS